MNEVVEAIRQTRRTLAERTWVPRPPDWIAGECCLASAAPSGFSGTAALFAIAETIGLGARAAVVKWNDRQADVGAVLGMTLQALIAELCKPTLAPRTTEA